MSETLTNNARNPRHTSRQRVSRKKNEVSVPVSTLSRDEIYDKTFNFIKSLQKTLFERYYSISTIGGGNVTLPRYFSHLYQKKCRSPQEFDFTLQETKAWLNQMGFKVSSSNFYLYKHSEHPSLLVFIKRFTNAKVLTLSLMRYYGDHTPTTLDLL